MSSRKNTHIALALLCVVALFAVGAAVSCPAFANEEADRLLAEADSIVAKINETTTNYQQTEAELTSLEEQIAQGEARLEELQTALPAQRARAAASIRSMYILQQSAGSLLDYIFSADTFDDFLTSMRYLDAIQERNTKEVRMLTSMMDEVNRTQALLLCQRDAAAQKQDEAQTALNDAVAARTELLNRANAAAEAERQKREEAIRAAQEAQESATSATFTTSSGAITLVEVPDIESVTIDPLITNVTSPEIEEWAKRIDAYLAGSPLEGHGATFAAAAAAYGVDPRLSPAISCIESGKGSVCFLPHNAWGWGSSSWADWESAIYEHVAGLASGYDGTLTLEGAMRYCPPHYQEWYSSVASEMNSI